MRNGLLLGIGAAVLAGCGSGGDGYKPQPVKPVEKLALSEEDQKALFPIAVGNQWTYAAQAEQRSGGRGGSARFDLTFKIVKVTPTADGEIADVEITSDQPGSKKDFQRWQRNSKGIFQLAVGNPLIPFDPPMPVILFPAETGRKFTWKGTGMTSASRSGTSSMTMEVLPVQEVFTESERFSAIGVLSNGTFSTGQANGVMASTVYLVPKVGLVRYRQEIASGQTQAIQTLSLKAKTVR